MKIKFSSVDLLLVLFGFKDFLGTNFFGANLLLLPFVYDQV